MIAPIIASFRWTRDEFLRAQRHAVRHSLQGQIVIWGTRLAGVLILFSGLATTYQHGVAWVGYAITVLFSAFFFSIPLFARRAALKFYARKPDRDMLVTWEISESGIRTGTELATSENSWAFFQKVRRLRQGFLIYPNTHIFHWLPLHAFREPEDAERFAGLAKSKVKDYSEHL